MQEYWLPAFLDEHHVNIDEVAGTRIRRGAPGSIGLVNELQKVGQERMALLCPVQPSAVEATEGDSLLRPSGESMP